MAAAIIVILYGALFLYATAFIILRPASASRFVALFASSAKAHFIEQAIRMVLGIALVYAAPESALPQIFQIFGWVIIITTIGLLLLPWRWHQWFANRVIPPLQRHLHWYAVGLFFFGIVLLIAATGAFLET